ncbi:MAG: hypothetical protein KAW41_04695 [Candidatus Diapherotrites archaeon]|nr:hypothetical protein [Candidatus Diapherotrites archaeon]
MGVSEYVAGNLFSVAQYLGPGQSANQTFRVPVSQDYYSGQYSMQLEDIGGLAYVKVRSLKWPQMAARHPLFLNTSYVELDTTTIYPPAMCARVSRNNTHYSLSLTC